MDGRTETATNEMSTLVVLPGAVIASGDCWLAAVALLLLLRCRGGADARRQCRIAAATSSMSGEACMPQIHNSLDWHNCAEHYRSTA